MSELISISIPTRNRASALSDLLSDISKAIKVANVDLALLRIYIFDNDSTDNTEDVVNNFKTHLPIIYKRNEENIGMGLNIYQAYTAIEGEYVWVIGDDELVPTNSLLVILNLINKLSPSLIILREKTYKNLIKLPMKFTSYEQFCKVMQTKNPHYLIAHSLISANVLKKSYFDKQAAMAAIDTYYGHMYGIASGLKKNESLVVLPKEETIQVRRIYLGSVDGFWPDSIEKEQVVYLEWLKNHFNLKIDPAKIIPNYRAKLMPNIFTRAIKYPFRKIKKWYSCEK